MNKRMFKKVQTRENKSKLVKNLIDIMKVNNELNLTKKELETIANFKVDNSYIANKNCDIKFVTDAKEFEQYLYEGKTGLYHSWAGEEMEDAKVRVILSSDPNISIGIHTDIDYSDNGDIREHDTYEHKDADFNIDSKIIIYRYSNSYSTFDGNHYDNDCNEIIIYDGSKSSYKVDDCINYIMNNFNLE